VKKFSKLRFLIFLSVLFITLISGLAQIRAQEDKYRIDNVTLRDRFGNPKSSFSRGEIVMVDATITNILSYTYNAEPFLMLASMERAGTMWGYGASQFSLLSGQSTHCIPGILVPSNAPTGSYTVTVFVWSNWASAGGYPIAADVQVTLTVT